MSELAQREASEAACHASLFGSFRLRRADGSDIAIANRRARVILAMLCAQTGQPIDRDSLSRLLWPGRFEAHARASLRQCLLDLGKLLAPLGGDILDVTRSTVALHPGLIRTDFGALEEALAQGAHFQATTLLDGIGTQPMLDGIDFGGAFDRWLTQCRSDAERRLGVAVEQRLTALAEAGDMSAHGRLLAAWSVRAPDVQRMTAPSKFAGKARIAVLPFQSLGGEPGQHYFTDGIVEELITALGQVPQLLVAGRTSSFHFRDSPLAIPQIADALRVTHLIEGSVQRQGEQVRVHVHLIDGASGFELSGQRYDGTLNAIFQLQEDVARAVTCALADALDLEIVAPQVRNLTHSKAAYDLYLQGRALNARLFGDGVLTRAAELLEEAVALDPDFAEAWVLLADVHQRMGIYLAGTDQTQASASMADCVRKAMAITPNLGQAYGLLALHEFTRNNIVGSLDLAFKGYEVEPNNPAVAVRIGGLLLFCGLTRQGMRYLDEAIEQDPVDGRHYMVRSAGQLNMGNIAAAIADAQRCVDFGFPSIWLGVAHAAAGHHDVAVEHYQQTRLMLNNSIPPPSGIAPMSPEMMDAYWLVAAKGVCSGQPEDRETYCRTLDFLHATMVEKEHLAITAPAVFMGYAELLFKTIGTRITLQNLACLMSIWTEIEPMCQIWQHPEFIPFAQRIGMAAAWDKYGWPDLLPQPSNL